MVALCVLKMGADYTPKMLFSEIIFSFASDGETMWVVPCDIRSQIRYQSELGYVGLVQPISYLARLTKPIVYDFPKSD
jgi:hypothetical protein